MQKCSEFTARYQSSLGMYEFKSEKITSKREIVDSKVPEIWKEVVSNILYAIDVLQRVQIS